ncbi:MAG: aminopeptidase P family protein [Candidatus Omnitrophica bacterium]|nr:aminopeptidase P family protein [Candidatus Omnitrophota bacterium]
MTHKITKLKAIIKKKRLDAFLVTDPHNVYYMSGFKSTDAALLITKRDNFLITDFRYKEDAQEISDFKPCLVNGHFKDTLKQVLKESEARQVGFEDTLPYAKANLLKEALKAEKIRIVPVSDLIEGLRLFKDDTEIKKIKATATIAKKALAALKIRRGATEKEIAQELDCLIRLFGADAPAFPTIVASGKNSSRPHAAVTNKTVRKNEPVLIDFGVNLNMYNCDLTRVFILGKMNALSDIYVICREAQQRAIEMIRPGISAKDVDKAARDYITTKGFGKSFGHALGHGIGLSVHELPQISLKGHEVLKPNMVFTVEPGIYIEKVGGIRIEDMVLVTKKGCEVLTNDIPK